MALDQRISILPAMHMPSMSSEAARLQRITCRLRCGRVPVSTNVSPLRQSSAPRGSDAASSVLIVSARPPCQAVASPTWKKGSRSVRFKKRRFLHRVADKKAYSYREVELGLRAQSARRAVPTQSDALQQQRGLAAAARTAGADTWAWPALRPSAAWATCRRRPRPVSTKAQGARLRQRRLTFWAAWAWGCAHACPWRPAQQQSTLRGERVLARQSSVLECLQRQQLAHTRLRLDALCRGSRSRCGRRLVVIDQVYDLGLRARRVNSAAQHDRRSCRAF